MWIVRHDDDQNGRTYVSSWDVNRDEIVPVTAEWTDSQLDAHRFLDRDLARVVGACVGGDLVLLVEPKRSDSDG